jgi:hypothetical protein
MNAYLTDEVDLVSVVHDADGVEVRVVTQGVAARVSERNRMVLDADGREVVGSMEIMLDPTVSIDYSTRVIVKRLGGSAYAQATKEWQIKQLSIGHLFATRTHVEVWV